MNRRQLLSLITFLSLLRKQDVITRTKETNPNAVWNSLNVVSRPSRPDPNYPPVGTKLKTSAGLGPTFHGAPEGTRWVRGMDQNFVYFWERVS